MSDPNSKVLRKSGDPTSGDIQVAKALLAMENSQKDIQRELRLLKITDSQEIPLGDKRTALVIVVNYTSFKAIRPIQGRITGELEKKFKRPVSLIFQRTILPKYLKRKGQQSIPRSRTLTAVHDAILEDLLHPVSILGRRMRVRTDGTRYFRVLLDPKDRDQIEEKLEAISAIYRKLCNKTVQFEFPAHREFPV